MRQRRRIHLEREARKRPNASLCRRIFSPPRRRADGTGAFRAALRIEAGAVAEPNRLLPDIAIARA